MNAADLKTKEWKMAHLNIGLHEHKLQILINLNLI